MFLQLINFNQAEAAEVYDLMLFNIILDYWLSVILFLTPIISP